MGWGPGSGAQAGAGLAARASLAGQSNPAPCPGPRRRHRPAGGRAGGPGCAARQGGRPGAPCPAGRATGAGSAAGRQAAPGRCAGGVAVRAGPACRSAVAEVVAAFPPLLPATAKGERPGAPAGPAAMCRQKGRLPWTQGRQPAHDALCVRVCIACCALRAFLASVPCGAATGMNESTGTQRQAPYQREQSRQSRLLRCGPAQVHA